MRLFARSVEQIERAYADLGHTLGWRFLYSPRRTLSPVAPLVFAGINPGGGVHHAPLASVAEGNAYRTERWATGGTLSPLQQQVHRLSERIAAELPGSSGVGLMDATLAANFCPFRSPSWQALPRKEESLAFSTLLWEPILLHVLPPVIITLTEVPFRHFRAILVQAGAVELDREDALVGWGSVTYSQALLQLGNDSILLLRLPHLSRFSFIGRSASETAVQRFTSAAAAHIRASGRYPG